MFNQYVVDSKEMDKVKHIHHNESCLTKQSPWGPSIDSKETAISKSTYFERLPSGVVYKSHTHTVSLPHIRVCFYRFKTKTNGDDNRTGTHLDNTEYVLMSYMFLKTDNQPLNNKANDTLSKI